MGNTVRVWRQDRWAQFMVDLDTCLLFRLWRKDWTKDLKNTLFSGERLRRFVGAQRLEVRFFELTEKMSRMIDAAFVHGHFSCWSNDHGQATRQ